MGTRDPRVDAYIDKAPEFARPILEHVRAIVHVGCPDVVESIKWGMPAFEHHGLLCGLAAFKHHATFGFWKHSLVVEGASEKDREAMGSFGKLTSVKDLPSKAVLTRYVKKAAKMNEDGVCAKMRSTSGTNGASRWTWNVIIERTVGLSSAQCCALQAA